jgi:hypothetical protein
MLPAMTSQEHVREQGAGQQPRPGARVQVDRERHRLHQRLQERGQAVEHGRRQRHRVPAGERDAQGGEGGEDEYRAAMLAAELAWLRGVVLDLADGTLTWDRAMIEATLAEFSTSP